MYKELLNEPEMDGADQEALQDLIKSAWFRRCLGSVVRELEGKENQLLACDLRTADGVQTALRLQGERAGMSRVLDLLMEETEFND